jgi:hypothetical protein
LILSKKGQDEKDEKEDPESTCDQCTECKENGELFAESDEGKETLVANEFGMSLEVFQQLNAELQEAKKQMISIDEFLLNKEAQMMKMDVGDLKVFSIEKKEADKLMMSLEQYR